MSILKFLVSVLFCCCLATAGDVPRQVPVNISRQIATTLYLSNGLPWGKWGPQHICPEGSFAIDFEVKFEPYQIADVDETALNAVKLYCETNIGHVEGYVTSSVGNRGDWQGMRFCSSGFLSGMRARVLPDQGVIGDDVAVQNLQMSCSDGHILTGVADEHNSTKIQDGTYGNWAYCPHETAICGIQTRLEDAFVVPDDTAIGDIVMYCCYL